MHARFQPPLPRNMQVRGVRLESSLRPLPPTIHLARRYEWGRGQLKLVGAVLQRRGFATGQKINARLLAHSDIDAHRVIGGYLVQTSMHERRNLYSLPSRPSFKRLRRYEDDVTVRHAKNYKKAGAVPTGRRRRLVRSKACGTRADLNQVGLAFASGFHQGFRSI